jgi:dienelactone hydrolase
MNIIMTLLVVIGFLLAPAVAHAKLVQKTITYKQGKTVLEGYLAFDDSIQGKRPAVLVVHDWMGISDETRRRVDMLAGLGYVAFAADVYGKSVRPKTPEEAGAQAGKYKEDRKTLRARLKAGLDTLLKQPQTDGTRVAAMGYCFGGTAALELARSGAKLVGVISFHGGLSTPTPADMKAFKGKVLVLHGAADPHVNAAEVAAFEQEVKDAGLDYQIVFYGGAVHAFTNPLAGSDPSKGVAYDEKADRRSWEAMKQFFGEVFTVPDAK